MVLKATASQTRDQTSGDVNHMNKSVSIDFTQATLATAPPAASSLPHPQSLLELPTGEARDSLLAVHELLGTKLPPGDLAIYEAGGGSTSFLPLDVLRRGHVTVVDIDAEQIRNNDYAQQTILGDVQRYRFPPGSFDLVICYNVIEHLPDAESALTRFCESLKQGGLMLIGGPNPRSLSGVVTKYSPHWFHVWFYRHVRGKKDAGQPGAAPFPTFFHRLVTLSNLEAFAKTHGLEVIYRKAYESPRYQEIRLRQPLFGALLDAAAFVINRLLAGTVDVRHGDYHVILRKP
jgi:SAM-dependent methyltransferase